MDIQKDIERLDKRIDIQRMHCNSTHENMNRCLIDIKTSLARIDERLISAFGELKEGDSAFIGLHQRVSVLEVQQQKWKGSMATIAAIGAFAINFLIMGIKMIFDYLTKKGGGN